MLSSIRLRRTPKEHLRMAGVLLCFALLGVSWAARGVMSWWWLLACVPNFAWLAYSYFASRKELRE